MKLGKGSETGDRKTCDYAESFRRGVKTWRKNLRLKERKGDDLRSFVATS